MAFWPPSVARFGSGLTRLRQRVQPQVQLTLTRSQPLAGDGFEQLEFDIVVRGPMCLMSRQPLLAECTICIAFAPEVVVTVPM
jgi:hypothetical protein